MSHRNKRDIPSSPKSTLHYCIDDLILLNSAGRSWGSVTGVYEYTDDPNGSVQASEESEEPWIETTTGIAVTTVSAVAGVAMLGTAVAFAVYSLATAR